MMQRLPILAGLALLALAFTASATPARADGYGHHSRHGWHGSPHGWNGGYSHHRYSHHRHSRRHYGSSASIGFVFVQPSPSVVYAPPPRVVYAPPPAATDCKPTTGTGHVNGRPALYGGTWCHDAYGRGYVVAGSERFLGYLQ